MNPAGEEGNFRSRGTGMRLRGLIRKEFLQIWRDPSSIAIAFLLPLVLLLIFGYGVSLDAQDVPVLEFRVCGKTMRKYGNKSI